MAQKLIVGCGYLGLRVAHRWLAAGDVVYGVTRSPQRAESLRSLGIHPIVADVTVPTSLRELPRCATVLFAVGYDRSAGQPIRNVYVQGLQNVLEALPRPADRLIYISSTGVYGEWDGDWVDETTQCRPIRDGGRACLEAEHRLRTHLLGAQSIILRMAGIYGPGRVPRLASLRAGEPIDAPAEGFLNLIHVDDAALIVQRVETCVALPALYVVSDGHPTLRRAYYEELARLSGSPAPRFVTPAADSPAALRAASDKRIRPIRLFNEVPITLQYPTYREGLAAIVRTELAAPGT